MHIRAYLFLLALGILLPAMLLSSLALRMLQNAEKEAALGSLGQTANNVALLVDRELYSAQAALRVLAASPSLAARDYRAFYAQARQVHVGGNGWSVLLDADGRELVNTAMPLGAAPAATPDGGRTRRLIEAGKTVVSDLAPSGKDGTLSTAISVPVTLADGGSYLLVRVFSTDHFVELLKGSALPAGWLTAILDSEGRFIARNVNATALVGTLARPELVSAASRAHSGRILHPSLEGTPIYDVFTHPSLSGWAAAVAAPVTQIGRPARDASFVAAIGLLGAMLAATALAGWFGRKHVQSMGRAVQAAVDLGNGIPPAAVHSRVTEINALHAALHSAGKQMLQARVYRTNAESARQSLLEGEQKARAMAEQKNMAKDQFLAMLGHELRNPMVPISTAAELLKVPAPDAARVRYASDVIARQVEHMNSLLGDLLDVSRVTRGLAALNLAPVELRDVIERALEQTNALVLQKKHTLVLDIPDGQLEVRGDRTRLIQLFANLVNNAAKYTAPGGRISIRVGTSNGAVSVVVNDNGEGFTQELLPRIFDLFSQAERTPDRAQGGLGLGLALVQSLVKLHNGSVTAFSAGIGLGSTFTVTLPYEVRSQPEPKAVLARPAELAEPNRLAIMIVDDNIDGAISLSLFLEEAGGHCVSTYYDAGTALGNAAAEAPDVFILDIGLPDITGYELVRRLRAMPQCAHAVYIALTGYGQPKDKNLAFEAGFDHHVSKSADLHAILDLLGQVIPQA